MVRYAPYSRREILNDVASEHQRWPPSRVNPMWFDPSTVRSLSRRRVLVDGVAGAGKTFMLGILLQKFNTVRYLVKKRNFVDATQKRFGYHEKLCAQTIDSFLMHHLGIRSLPLWLHKRKVELDKLKQRLRNNPVRRNDSELIFVDEYSLIEQSLAELLNCALVNRLVVLVGDYNQQPAIGDSTDQPVRTLLSYEYVYFMYDNVLTKDARLLQRLSHFSARTEDMRFKAINGLPLRRNIDMSDFFATDGSGGGKKNYALLPRVMVVLKDKVNYLNLAMGYLIVSNTKKSSRDKCLRYKRKVILSRDAFRELIESLRSARPNGRTRCRRRYDDGYATGHRYRPHHLTPQRFKTISDHCSIREFYSR